MVKKISGLSEETVKAAIDCGLYKDEGALMKDLLIDREDDFNRLAAEHTLQSQIKTVRFKQLRKLRGVINVGNVKEIGIEDLAMVLVVNGPGRMGSAVGPKGYTAEFKIKMRGNDWVFFLGQGEETPISVLSRAIGAYLSDKRGKRIVVRPGRIKAATERVVRICSNENWIKVKKFPIDVADIEDPLMKEWLVETSYGVDSSHAVQAAEC